MSNASSQTRRLYDAEDVAGELARHEARIIAVADLTADISGRLSATAYQGARNELP